jgi:translocation and assembly module TamB
MSGATPTPDAAQVPGTPETPSSEPVPEKRRRRSWLRIPLKLLFQTLVLVLLVVAWVLGTQSGLRFSLSLVEEFVPGLVRVERADGRVLGDLHLTGLAVRAPGLELDLGSLELRWGPLAALTTGTLRIDALIVQDLDVVAAPAEKEEADAGPIELPQIVLPLVLELDKVLVERLSVGAPGGEPPFRVDRIALAAAWAGSELTLKDLSVALPEPLLNASAQGTAELSGDYPLDLGLSWDLSREPALKLSGEGRVGGDLKRLEVTHDLTGSAWVRLEAFVQEVLDGPRWEGTLEILGVDLPAIGADLPAVELSGRLTTSGDLDDARVEGNLAGEAPELPDFGRLKAVLDVTWRGKVLDIAALELTEDMSGALLTADGQLDVNDPAGRFVLQAAWEKLRWPLSGELIAEARQGKIDASGTFDEFAYRASAEIWGRDFPEASLELAGDGDRGAARIQELRLDTLEGTVAAEGRVVWAPALSWEVTLGADGINPGAQWPQVPAQIALRLTSAGNLDRFEYGLEGEVGGEALPASLIELRGEGDVQGTRVETLRLETLGGHLDANADLAWAPALTWDAELELADIDPGKHWPEWAGLLAGRLVSKGSVEPEGPDLSAALESFGGELRGYPVDASGSVRMKGAEIQVEELRVASGPSNLRVAGSAGEQLDLEVGLSSPDLKSLLPDAAGSVKASGTLSGSLTALAIKLGLEAKGVAVAAQGIQNLNGVVDLDFAQGGAMKIDLTGKGLAAGGMAFDSLRVQGDGELGSHRLTAKVQGEPLALDLTAAGGLKEDNLYAGELEGLTLRTEAFGNWRLQKAAPVALAGARISAGPVCIRDEGGSGGCAGFEQTEAGNWSATLDLDRLAFELLAEFIPEGMVLDGGARAKADFRAQGGVLAGSASVQVPEGVFSAASGDERIEVLNFSSANLGVNAGADGLRAKLALPLKGLGDLSGEVSLPGWSLEDPARPGQSLRGGVQARVDDLGVVSRFVPDITNLTGNLNADFKLGGTVSKPGLSGSARLANGGLEVPFIGLAIEDLAFDANARSLERIEYSGGLRAGDGRLEIGGQSVLGADGINTEITARGEKLTLADSKEYFVLASPDIEAKIGPIGTRLTGTVTVPEARIRPRSIPAGSVSASSDVMLASEAEEQTRYTTSMDVRLVLGEQVTVNAFGLEGSIQGELAVLQAPGKEILGDGELAIVDGTYRISTGGKWSAAVGKPLDIEQGFLNYAKSPINNPFLVLTAQREGGDVTAGLRVFGTIKNPKMTFFSATDPGMSQSEVTKYLLTGIPPKRSGEQPADRALSVGTYVAPKLFAEYDHSLGDEADKIKLRYDLNDWIELQTETGDSQGGDIFFKIEN